MLRAMLGICLAIGFSARGFADQLVPLARLTNDRDTNVQELFVAVTPSGQVSGIQFTTSYDDGTASAKSFTMPQIESGAVLNGDASHDFFILQGQVAGEGTVGDLTIRYLSNGLSDDYKECKVSLLRGAQGTWGLYNATTGDRIDSILITTWSLGIDQVQNVCD